MIGDAKLADYQAGACNIGKWNRILRAAYGIALLAISLAAWWWLRENAARFYRLGLAVPLYIAFIGIYQAYFGFCIYHAARHSYDMR